MSVRSRCLALPTLIALASSDDGNDPGQILEPDPDTRATEYLTADRVVSDFAWYIAYASP